METKLEDLRKWFGKGKKGDWVRVGTDGEIKGDCAREPGEGKPKCMPRSKAHSMDKKDRASSARRKRAADPQVDRPGTGNTPIMVKTDKEKKKKVDESSKIPAGMKFIASYVYKDANGKDHTHRHLRKGSKMSDPVVVYIDGKEWKTFQSFTKAKQAAINHIKGMKESVNEEARLKAGDKVKTSAGTVEIKDRDTRGMRGKQDKYEMILTMKDGKKVSMGSHPQPTATAVTNIAKRHFSKGVPSYMKHMQKESVELDEASIPDILTTIGSSKNMNQAVQMVMKKYKVDQGKAKAMVKKAIDSGVTYDKIKKKYAKESVDLEEKNVPTNPALWAKMKAKAKAKFDVYPSAYANGWAAKQYKAAGGGWKTESVKEMKTFWDVREGAMSKDKETHDTGGFRISNKDAQAAKDRLKQKRQKSASQNKSYDGVRSRLAK